LEFAGTVQARGEAIAMKKWIELGSVAAVVVIAALGALCPARALAAQDAFLASGPILTIDDGNVDAAGNSGRFVVKEREVRGTLSGFVGNDVFVDVPFTFTFGTNVPLMTQSGNLHGTLTFNGYEAKVAAKSTLGVTPAPCPESLADVCVPSADSPTGFFFPGLLINGTLTFTSGAQGHGTADAWVVPVIDPLTGHIVGVVAGQLTIKSN
jgi:hypothetical protein